MVYGQYDLRILVVTRPNTRFIHQCINKEAHVLFCHSFSLTEVELI